LHPNTQLTGNIPSEYKYLSTLTQALINDNLFGWRPSHLGPLPPQPDFVDPDYQKQLYFVDISNNPFTGSLSPTFFRLPSLQYFSASVMCLNESTLPQSICQATNLQSLIISGLTSHPSCTLLNFPNLQFLKNLSINVDGTNSNNFMLGTIPSCIFTLPNLTDFQASGNRFTGSLPSITTAPFKKLVLSHNILTGSVPTSIWMLTDLVSLDLSKNRLRGRIYALHNNPNITTNVAIKLDVNRYDSLFFLILFSPLL